MQRHSDNFAGIYELTEIRSAAQPRRASGPDSITDDLARMAPQEMARHTHPAIAKAALYCREGVAHT
eukprot:4413371-Pyramimonas_sp.AAC.1